MTEAPLDNLATMTPGFKRDALAYIVKDQLAAKTAAKELPDDFFEFDPDLHIIFSGFKEFVETYNCRPRKHELVEILEKRVKDSKMDERQQENLFASLEGIWDHDSYTPHYVRDKLYDGITTHSIFKVTQQIPEYVNDGDYDGLVAAMSKARHAAVEDDMFVEYWADTTDRIERRKHELVRLIPTNLLPVDEEINGGLPRGSLAMLMGGSGYGKSAILAQIALNASLQGYTVAFLTLELARDAVMARLDANVAGFPLAHVSAVPKKIKKGIYEAYTENPVKPGPLYVQYYPTKSISVKRIEEYVKRLRDEQGVTVDLLVVDYFDLLRMEGTYTKKYEALEENIEILRGLGGIYDMGIWTASQVNRPGLGKETVDMDDIAGGFGKVFPLDLLITISQTKEEKIQKIFRLHFAKSRLGPSGGEVFVQPDFEKMRFNVLTASDAEAMGLVVPKPKKRYRKTKERTASMGEHVDA